MRVVSEDALATGVIGSVAEAVQVVSDVAAATEGSVEVTVASVSDVFNKIRGALSRYSSPCSSESYGHVRSIVSFVVLP